MRNTNKSKTSPTREFLNRVREMKANLPNNLQVQSPHPAEQEFIALRAYQLDDEYDLNQMRKDTLQVMLVIGKTMVTTTNEQERQEQYGFMAMFKGIHDFFHDLHLIAQPSLKKK